MAKKMPKKTTQKPNQKKTPGTSNRAASEPSWDDFRPEWANEGIERINQELEKWTDEFQSRSAKFREESQKRIEESVLQVQEELRKIPALKRAEEMRTDLERRVEQTARDGRDKVFERLKLARLDEVKKLERKIAQLNKKLNALEKKKASKRRAA